MSTTLRNNFGITWSIYTNYTSIYRARGAETHTPKFDNDLRVKYNSWRVDSRRLNDISTIT